VHMTPRVTSDAGGRSQLLPAAGLPLFYFGFAHLCLALGFSALLVNPTLPGSYFLHPRMVALVHLVTLGWISGSILGAFYIVAPLALRMPFRPGWRDRAACAAFVAGVSGMIAHFWLGEYHGMVWSAGLVTIAVLHVAIRAWAGLVRATVPWPVKLHVALAFANILAASVLGMAVGLDRVLGWFGWPPLPAAFGHAHLAAIGWAVMMVVGLSYRLIPMIVPASMPTGSSMAASAILIQTGLVVLVIALFAGSSWSAVGAALIVAGLASFVTRVRAIVARKLPRPAALPRPDWATWQTHVAFVWLIVAATLGLALSTPIGARWSSGIGWIYGCAGLVGFLAQVVVGIQGRLLPLHGWYRAYELRNMQPPERSAHTLASPRLARAILVAWTLGVPILCAGLAGRRPWLIASAGAILLGGVVLNAAQMLTIVSSAGRPAGH
jgi:hypothetical protein